VSGGLLALAAVLGFAITRLAAARQRWRTRARVAALGRPDIDEREAAPIARLRTTAAAWRARRHGDRDAVRTLPDTVDLLAVAARSGLPVRAAVLAVASRAPPPWSEPLGAVAERCRRGEALVGALDALSAVGDPARALVTVLRDAALDGGDLHRDLTRVARDARELRRRAAEQAARRVPVRLLVPLVTCSLPAFALLTVVPALVGALGSLRL
jgi:Flp pilus assembly protein TadB